MALVCFWLLFESASQSGCSSAALFSCSSCFALLSAALPHPAARQSTLALSLCRLLLRSLWRRFSLSCHDDRSTTSPFLYDILHHQCDQRTRNNNKAKHKQTLKIQTIYASKETFIAVAKVIISSTRPVVFVGDFVGFLDTRVGRNATILYWSTPIAQAPWDPRLRRFGEVFLGPADASKCFLGPKFLCSISGIMLKAGAL